MIETLNQTARSRGVEQTILVAPNRGAGREILRRIARTEGWIAIEHATPASLAGELVALELAREGLVPVDELEQREIVDVALDAALEEGGRLADLSDGVGFRDAVANAVEALRLAGIDRDRLLKADLEDEPKQRALAEVLEGYERGLAERGRVDAADVFRRAIAALESGGGPDARVFLHPNLRTRGLSGRFVAALVERGAEVLPGAHVPGLPAPAVLGGDGADGSRLSWLHAVADAAEPAEDDPELHLFAAGGPADELREVLRRVIASGRSWDEVEIVATEPTVYGCALDALATRLSIPVTYAVGLPAGRTRQGRAVTAYLEWIQEDFPAEILRTLLETGDVRPPAGEDGASVPGGDRLARRLRRLRIGWGRARYGRTIENRLAWLDEAPTEPGPGERRSAEEIAEARAKERAELTALDRLLGAVLDTTPAVPDRVGKGGQPVSPADLARGVLAFLAHVPAPTPVEEESRRRMVEMLERIEARLTRPTGFGSALSILRGHLDLRVPSPNTEGPLPWSSAGGALHLSDLEHGGWTGRPMTFVVGLDADRFPGAGIQDPLLLDEDRRALDPEALPTATARLEETRWGLAALLSRLEGTVTISCSTWSTLEGRDVAPAADVLQALRLQRGDPTANYEDLTRALAPIACPVPRGAGRIDAADVWLVALAGDDGLRSGVPAVLEAYPRLAAGLEARKARSSPAFTAWDGRVEPRPDALDPRRTRRVVSASQLRGLAGCPLSHLYRKVLNLDKPDDPELEPGQWLEARDRGKLLHDVYEMTLRIARERGIAIEDDRFESLAREVLDEQVARYRGKVPVPSEVVFRHEADALRREVGSFVRHVRDTGADWVALEMVVGYGSEAPPAVELELEDGSLHVGGRIDRIDRGESGLVIIDYKTGSTRKYQPEKGTWAGGRHLQHLLYTKIAEALYDEPVDRMEYHFPTAKGRNQAIPYEVARLAEGEAVLEAILGHTAEGWFVPSQDEGDCKWCDYQAICRVEVDEWNKIDSPPVEWAKERWEELEEYEWIRALRSLG